MNDIKEAVSQIDWQAVSDDLNNTGYAILPGFLNKPQCQRMIDLFNREDCYRKTVMMERYRFGAGVYKYWDYPLPNLVQNLRTHLYPKLAPMANRWMTLLHIDTQFPTEYADLQAQCHAAGQTKATPLILKYEKGGYNTLHQDLYGDLYFPIQAACFLSEPNEDFTGGEFILTEQVPRAQSKATAIAPKRGDMMIFTTSFRPVKGSRGYYRASIRHGVSEVRSGRRYAMGIIFHDAVS